MADQPHSIILSGGTPADVGPAMAKLFAIDPKLAGQIAGAAPIVLVEDLTADQAGGVRAALDELAAAGAGIEVKAGSVGSIPKVGWGGVPKIAGKLATEYTSVAPPAAAGAPGSFCCPACGASFTLVQQGAAAAVPSPAPAGAKMTAKDSGFEEIPLPDALKALESPPELPDVPEIPAAAPAPKAEPQPQPVGGAIKASKMNPSSSGPMALEDFEAGLASDDSLLADLDDGLPDVPDEPVRPVPAKRAAKAPLVNVQGMDQIGVQPLDAPAAPVAKAKAAPVAKAKAAPVAKAKPAAPKAKAAPVAKAKAAPSTRKIADPAAGGGNPDEKVNIFANRSNNPELIGLLAKIRGVSEAEAEELAAKPLVTVAKNISRKQAEVIRKKFSESKISVRLTPVRASQRMKPPDIKL